jgi:hypothetical protein
MVPMSPYPGANCGVAQVPETSLRRGRSGLWDGRGPLGRPGRWMVTGDLSIPPADDPGTAVADRAQGAKVVRPVGRSTLAPWSQPATPEGGSTANGMDSRCRYAPRVPEFGDIGTVLVWFIEDRNGKALVRLPNGSKTSLPYEALDILVRGDDLPRPATTDDLSIGALLEPYRRRPHNERSTSSDANAAGDGSDPLTPG